MPLFTFNLVQMEFPAYWNFFIKGRSTTLVCAAEVAPLLREVADSNV